MCSKIKWKTYRSSVTDPSLTHFPTLALPLQHYEDERIAHEKILKDIELLLPLIQQL